MEAHLINTHLLVPRSGSSAKVNIKYQGHISQKMGFIGGISVSQTHLVTLYVRVENMGIGEMLVMSISSFFINVFNRHLIEDH